MDILTPFLLAFVDSTSAAFALAAIGLGVHFGYAGLLNFGQAGFMAIGAYGFAIWTTMAAPTANWGWPPAASFISAVIVGLVAASIYAFVLGIPTLRLRGDYLAIVTIAAAEIVRYTVRTTELTPITGGSQGLTGAAIKTDIQAINPLPPGQYGFWIFNAGAYDTWIRILAWVLVAIALIVVWMLFRSPWGRVVKGIREDEDAVRSLGKNVFNYKMQVLILGGVLGALGGIMYVMPRALQPDFFAAPTTFYLWTALLLGGAATVFGPVIGAILFWATLNGVRAVIRLLHDVGVFGDITATQAAQLAFVFVGFALILLVVFRPQGIFGNKKELSFNV
ncbi:branched-chain amino acid ABC transporter permease [uncultured Agrococcus sp.]|uniref:branched-chain amino acid ABC transporter permease n=1 Tax=uncultured Agrococcus sp. TaxID=382258 RepID=UPI0025D6CA6D|nr:branched-chain amino acid ABC transporter permease [uncultured Agrococcus sp.]